MCGIHALIGDVSRLDDMVQATIHRGPDATGVWSDARIGLGHNRLSILDLSAAGSQPMWNADKTIGIVYNGEIYNHKELRKGTQRAFLSSSDTETILALYEQEGIRFVDKLWGMYAFVLYDKKNNVIHAVRDPDGMKPLVYAERRGEWAFASELASLFVRFKPDAIDPEALRWYLSMGYVPAPRTFYKGFSALRPGELLSVSLSDGTRTHGSVQRVMPEHPADFSAGLRASLERHLLSDVPVGLFLSGGLDSSVLAAGLVKDLNVRPESFHVSIPGRRDTEHARMVARSLGLSLHEISWSGEDAVRQVENAVLTLSQPLADIAFLPLLKVSELASKHVKVVLSGDGADELFFGYGRHTHLAGRPIKKPDDVIAGLYGLLPRKLRAGALRFSGDTLGVYLDQMRLSDRGITPSAKDLQTMLEPRGIDYGELLDRALYLSEDLLPKTDLAGMHYGLEGRLPFLDPAMQAYADQLPGDQKRKNGIGKLPLRRYLQDRGLGSVSSQDKQGFGIPVRELVQTNRKKFEAALRAFLARPEVQNILGKTTPSELLDREPVLGYACSVAELVCRKQGV